MRFVHMFSVAGAAGDAPARFLRGRPVLNHQIFAKLAPLPSLIVSHRNDSISGPRFSMSLSRIGAFRHNPFSSISFSQSVGPPIPKNHVSQFLSGTNGGIPVWSRTPNAAALYGKERVGTVVLLGWLGAKTKHLRRYVEWYNARGLHAVTFVVDVGELLGFFLGRRLEPRVAAFADELASWVSEREEDGRERFLVLHAFSNAGWFVYGLILDNFLAKKGLLDKVEVSIFDSSGGDPFDPKVWAAGFAAALLKKRSSAALPAVEAGEQNELKSEANMSKKQGNQTSAVESMVLSLLEKLFSFTLKLPQVEQRVTKFYSILSKSQPNCPQLYFYSTADKIIPFQNVESFIDEQRRTGRKVRSFNFETSPHVDHYRTFPNLYSSELHSFLDECFATAKQS